MSTRNFNFLKSPQGGRRGGEFVLGGTQVLTSGVPVIATTGDDGFGRRIVELAPDGTAKPDPGFGGILVYENIDDIGYDTRVFTTSDMDTVAPGRAVQVVTGNSGEVAVQFTNTITGAGNYDRPGYPVGRIMVAAAGPGASATVDVGDYLVPGAGSDAAGYWKTTSTRADAWLRVTAVGPDFGLVEAEVLI